jgi:hypothetical protein
LSLNGVKGGNATVATSGQKVEDAKPRRRHRQRRRFQSKRLNADDNPAELGRSEAVSIGPIGGRYESRQYLKKSSRRSARQLSAELIAARNMVWQSQDRTRFGRRIGLGVAARSSSASAMSTLWLSFERRILRPPILGLMVVLAIAIIMVLHLRTLSFVGHGGDVWPLWRSWTWHQYSYGDQAAAEARYDSITGPAADAVVTALIGPAALASFLARPSEHTVLSQLLRTVRAVLMIAAAPLFVLALLIALDSALWIVASTLTAALAVGAVGFGVSVFAYKNCERLPARPGWVSRFFIWRREHAQQRAVAWLKKRDAHESLNRSPPASENSRWWTLRRSRALAKLWRSPSGELPRGATIEECIAIGNAISLELRSSMERATKQPRRLPYDDPYESTSVFTVRLNTVDCVEVEPVAAALAGVDEDRDACMRALAEARVIDRWVLGSPRHNKAGPNPPAQGLLERARIFARRFRRQAVAKRRSTAIRRRRSTEPRSRAE